MFKVWQIQEAKNKFSEVVEKALKEGPQIISKRGIESVIVVSINEYRKLKKKPRTIVEFFQQSPLKGLNLLLVRNKDKSREVEF